MSKNANPGELRTLVRFVKTERVTDSEGYPTEEEKNVFGDKNVFVKWVNAHGSDAFIAMQMQLREPATLTMRYTDKVDTSQLVYRGNDPDPFEIISIDNVEERNRWLEIKVQRRKAAR